jgi:hypothetical protein
MAAELSPGPEDPAMAAALAQLFAAPIMMEDEEAESDRTAAFCPEPAPIIEVASAELAARAWALHYSSSVRPALVPVVQTLPRVCTYWRTRIEMGPSPGVTGQVAAHRPALVATADARLWHVSLQPQVDCWPAVADATGSPVALLPQGPTPCFLGLLPQPVAVYASPLPASAWVYGGDSGWRLLARLPAETGVPKRWAAGGGWLLALAAQPATNAGDGTAEIFALRPGHPRDGGKWRRLEVPLACHEPWTCVAVAEDRDGCGEGDARLAIATPLHLHTLRLGENYVCRALNTTPLVDSLPAGGVVAHLTDDGAGGWVAATQLGDAVVAIDAARGEGDGEQQPVAALPSLEAQVGVLLALLPGGIAACREPRGGGLVLLDVGGPPRTWSDAVSLIVPGRYLAGGGDVAHVG